MACTFYDNRQIVNDGLTQGADDRSNDLQQFRHIFHHRVQRLWQYRSDYIGHFSDIAVGIRDALCKLSEQFNASAGQFGQNW